MASPTNDRHEPPVQQRPMMPPAPATTATPVTPVLFEDIDPVLLVRLYPGLDYAEARAKALADGKITATEGAKLEAAAQQPIPGTEPPPPPPSPRHEPDRK